MAVFIQTVENWQWRRKNKAWHAGEAPHIRRDQEDKRIRVLFYFPVGP